MQEGIGIVTQDGKVSSWDTCSEERGEGVKVGVGSPCEHRVFCGH